MALASTGVISLMPEVCVSRWRIVIVTGLPSTDLRSLNSGKCFWTGSSTDSFPSSWSMRTAVAVTGLVIEAIQKIVSGCIGLLAVISALPIASRCTIRSGVATSVTMPETSRSSTNERSRSLIAEMTGGLVPLLGSWQNTLVVSSRNGGECDKRIVGANLRMAIGPFIISCLR